MVVLVAILLIVSCGDDKKKKFVYFRNFSRTFCDLNDKHLGAARQIGIRPVSSEDNIGSQRGKLEKVSSCRFYKVDDLTHSLPYLVPQACDLLEDIGRNFKDSLDCKGLSSCKIIVTSVLRTNTSVKQLRRQNTNASANSAHIYGTTFDVAYTRYEGGEDERADMLKTVLAEVLRDLRKQKRCYVRYEYKQGCFHITTRGE